jgi:hypothetical protein
MGIEMLRSDLNTLYFETIGLFRSIFLFRNKSNSSCGTWDQDREDTLANATRMISQERQCYRIIFRALASSPLIFFHRTKYHSPFLLETVLPSLHVSLSGWRPKVKSTCASTIRNDMTPVCPLDKRTNMDLSVCHSRPVRLTWHLATSSCVVI